MCNCIQRTQQEKAQEYGRVCGCPYAGFGAELTTNDERVRIKVEELIERSTTFIESAIADAIREGSVSVNDPKTSARQIFSYVLGCFSKPGCGTISTCFATLNQR